MNVKYEVLTGIIATVIIVLSSLVSYNIIQEKRLVAMGQSIEIATNRGINPLAIRCAYADSNDNICIVYTSVSSSRTYNPSNQGKE